MKYKLEKQREKDRQRIGLSRNSLTIVKSTSKKKQRCDYHLQHQVPNDPVKFDALLHKLVSIGKRSPSKLIKIRQVLDELAPVKQVTLLQLHALKSLNRKKEHNESVAKICQQFGNMAKAVREYDISEKAMRQLCKPIPEEEDIKCQNVKASNEAAKNFWLEGHISVPDPSIRQEKIFVEQH